MHDQVDNFASEELITYTYDGAGNLQSVDVVTDGQLKRYTIAGNDGKKNPFRLMSQATFIYIAGKKFYTVGNANPLNTEALGVPSVIYSWTYNDAGYPAYNENWQ